MRTSRAVYGTGSRAVAVTRRDGARDALPAVLFLHGWGYQQSDAYGPWIRHLAREGNVVIVPRYQIGLHSDPAGVREAMLAGLRHALRRTNVMPGTLIAAGHSAGAALAADYAAIAERERLPSPLAVFAVYPGRAILGTTGIPSADLGSIPASTRLIAMAGADDAIVGQQPARDMIAAAASVPPSRRRFILVDRPDVADHLAPLRATAAVRRTFWRPLDRMIARARNTGG